MSSISIGDSPSSEQTRPIAPIDALPDELLLEIFAFGAQSVGNPTFSFLVSTICQSWRSLAINEARLWTSLTVTVATAVNRLPLPAEDTFHVSEVFPKESTTLERSANRDFDFYLHLATFEYDEIGPLDSFNDMHIFVLSELLRCHAHHMRTFHVTMEDWESVFDLCTRLQGMAMPRLEIWDVTAFNIEPGFWEDGYERGYSVEPIHVLEYASDDNLPVNSLGLQGSRRSLQPALKHVHCSGIPLNWGLFSPSNLQRLCLQYQPWSGRPSMEDLLGILWNSKDTLEHLELTYVVGLYGLLPEPPLPDARLVLRHITHLVLGYISFREAREVLQAIDFPALRTLSIRSLQAGLRSGDVLIDVLKYIRVEELLDLRLVNIVVPPMDYIEGDVGGPAEESLSLILQLFHRLSRGHLRTLTLEDCCHCFLKFMNYGREMGGGSVNLSGLKELSLQVSTEDGSQGLVSFLRERLELGTVNGAYAGPVLEKLMLTMNTSVQEQLEGLGELAKERQISFD